MLKKNLCFFLFLALYKPVSAQCVVTVTSTSGWSATLKYQPVSVYPEFTPCQWYYHYFVVSSYTVTFTGSTSGRSVDFQLYYTCKNNSGTCTPYVDLGTFTGNATGTATVNNSCEFDAVSAYNYGSNPDCYSVSLSNVNCTTARIDYYGTGLTNSSVYCYGIGTPLPIELLSFTAKADDGKVDLNWATATETNNNYYTVERSPDGITFEEVTQVKGAGTSTQELNYTATDTKPFLGLSYYRLKQTDNNGAFKYLPIVSVKNNLNEIIITNVHPNPTTSDVDFDVYSPNKGTLRIQLKDEMGRVIFDKTQSMQESRSTVHLETSSLPQGLYTLQAILAESGLSSVSKLIKN